MARGLAAECQRDGAALTDILTGLAAQIEKGKIQSVEDLEFLLTKPSPVEYLIRPELQTL